ncbi:hypothetical protein SDC9_36596 [bioreactor metagenome]|uniref:NAD-specific glutamate dehydrogenase n=1 Tax=bioreactor metagenome TaxID=1076179 RepID=A0A644VIW5_9ZZZZ
MRGVLVGVDFFPLERGVALDQALGEHVAGEQEVVIGFQRFQSFTQRAADGRDRGQFFRRQVVEVLVRRRARIDLVLDAVEAGHHQRREGEIGVGRRIGEPGFDALGLRRFGPRNTDAARAVAGRIGAQHRSLEARDQTLVRVRRRVGEGVQGLGVLQDTADEVQRFLRQVGIFVAGEERLAVLPDRHVDVHARAVVTLHRLRHEGHGLAVGVGHVVDHVLVLLDVVGLLDQTTEDHAQLMLAGRDLMVVLVDLHAHALHGREHLATQVLGFVDRVHREVAALVAGAMREVAGLDQGIGVPGSGLGVDLVADLGRGDRVAHVVEDEEFGFRAEVGGIADARGLQIGFGLVGNLTRAALIGFAGVRLDHVAMHAHGLFGIEGVDVDRGRIGDQLHVGLVDRLPAGDRRAVEHEAFLEEVLVDEVGHQRHVLQLAARVGEADVDVFDFLRLHQFESFLDCAHCK